MEVFGLDFEQFQIGQKFRHRPGITISAQDITEECLDTFNAAQIHYDEQYAGHTEFKNPLGVSTLILQKCFGAAWKTFARKDRILEFSSIELTSPVFAGVTIYAESEILEKHEGDQDCGILTVCTRAVDYAGTVFFRVTYQIGIFRAGRHPYYGSVNADFSLNEPRFAAYNSNLRGYFTEQTGLYFDDLQTGETYHHQPEKYFDSSESLQHARHSLDWNPRFTNPIFARNCFSEKSPPITEAYFLGAMTATTTRTLGRVVANLAWSNVKLKRLVYPGESFRTSTEIREKRDSRSRPDQGIMVVTSKAFDQNDEEILSYNRTLLIYRRNHGPYRAAGY